MQTSTIKFTKNGISILKPIVVLDEIDSMNHTGDFGGFGELVRIVKQKNKNAKWSSPLILICNDMNTNKYTELLKFSDVIEVKEPRISVMLEICDSTSNKLDEEVVLDLAKKCKGDIRLFLNTLQIENTVKNNDINSETLFEERVDQNIHLYKRIETMLLKPRTHDELLEDFYIDQSMIPSMMYENIYKFVYDESNINVSANISEFYSFGDVLGNNIFNQTKFQLLDIYGLCTCAAPVKYLQLEKTKFSTISFPMLMTKNAGIYANKKAILTLYRQINMKYEIEHFQYIRKIILGFMMNNNTIDYAIQFMKIYGIQPETIFNCIKVKNFDEVDYKKINNVRFKKQVVNLYCAK